MALTKAQISQVTVAALGAAPGGYEAQLAAFNTQDELAVFLQDANLLGAGKTNAEYALEVKENAGDTAAQDDVTALFNALEAGTSRAEAVVDFVGKLLVTANPEFDAKIDAAKAYTGGSTNVAELKAVLADQVDNGLTVTFTDVEKDKTEDQPGVGTGTGATDTTQTIYNVGKAQLDAGQSKISADYTFELKDQIGENDTFDGLFLSPIIDRQAAESSGSQIVLELRNLREDADSTTPLKDLPTNGFGFRIGDDLVIVASEAIDAAQNYDELLTAIQARVTELANGVNLPDGADSSVYSKLGGFTVEFGATKQAQARNADGEVTETYNVNVTEIVLTDQAGAVLSPAGYSNRDGVIDGSGFTLFSQMTDEGGSTITKLITTNLELDNVGYGSQGASVNLAGQSASDKGVEEIKVTANNGVWLTTLTSKAATNHLERIELQTGSDDYFRVGTQKNDANHIVALVDEDFAKAGLVDVQQLSAAAAESVAINSRITDAVINRFDLKDTGLFNADDNEALIDYDLTSGNDVLQLQIDTEVVAYADTVVDIDAGAGNDFVHLQLKANADYGESWLSNQQLNDNISIDATSGNNTIWTEGAGNAKITTGSGADTIYTDNSGKITLTDQDSIDKLADLGYGKDMNALFAFNAASADLGDIVSNTNNGLDNNATNTAQVFNTFKNTVSVSFKGFETTHVTIESTNYTTSTQQVNQAIKKAILEDATLSKLLTVKEFPGNVLVVESLIDGEMVLSDLSFDFVAPAATGTAATALTKGQLVLGANDLTEAGKAYAAPGTANPTAPGITALNFSNNAAGIEAIYNTNKAFVTDGPGSTAEVQEIDFTSVNAALATGQAGTIQVGSVNIALETGDDANAIATKVAAQLNGKMQNADLGVALVGGAADAAVTATASNGVVTITYATTAGDVATVGSPATVAPSVAAPALGITAVETATGNAGVTAEVQTISQAQIAGFATAVTNGSVTMVIGQQEVVINATDTADQIGAKLAAALDGKAATADLGLATGTADGNANAVYTNGADLVVTFDIGSGTVDDLVTTTPAVTGAQAGNITGIAPSEEAAGNVVDTGIDGKDSTAHSDNVVNAGAGNDVIVLGTDDESNDTVVLSGNFGKTTIVNFDDTAAADTTGNGGDLLDLTAYLNSNYGADHLANVTLDNDGTLDNGNTVSVVDFSSLQSGNADGFATTDALTAAVNTTKLAFELNADFNAGTDTATKHVFLIHNDNATNTLDNAGEYFVVTASSTAATADLSDVKVVGTLDFGEAQNFVEGNFVDFA